MEDDLVLMSAFLDHLTFDLDLKEGTIDTYQHFLHDLVQFLDRRESGILLATPNLLTEFTGSHAHKQGISRSSRRPMVAAVRGLFRWLHAKQYRDNNPAKSLEYPKAGRPLPVPMSLTSVEKIFFVIDFSELRGLRDAAMIALMVDSGIRLSGLIGLNKSSLVSHELKGKRRISIRVLEKGKKERIVPLTNYSLVYLSTYLHSRELMEIDRTLPDGDEVIFVSLRNRHLEEHEFVGEERRICARSVQRMLRQYAKAAGVSNKEAHPHALRHTFATELVESGVDLIRVRNLLGHADLKTTEIYVHLAARRMFESVDSGSPLSKVNSPLYAVAAELS